jgi:hypothetical protein
MPYYVGAGEPEWDEYLDQSETPSVNEPVSLFKYIEPWQAETTVLRFAETAGAEPEIPKDTVYRPSSTPRRGFFARLFGKPALPVIAPPNHRRNNWSRTSRGGSRQLPRTRCGRSPERPLKCASQV